MIRYATRSDAEQLFAWRNLPESVELSELGRTVTWAEHTDWMTHVLERRNSLLFMVDGEVGYVRLDLRGPEASVSVYIAPAWRKDGWGSVAVSSAIEKARILWPGVRFVARVRAHNTPSLRLFAGLGFSVAWERAGLVTMERR